MDDCGSIMSMTNVKVGNTRYIYVAQLVGCWTHNPRVVGLIPIDANSLCGITSLGKMLTWTVPLSTQGKYGYPAIRDTGFCALPW